MKKQFMFISAILLGMVICLASCKDSKKSSWADEEDGTEQVEKTKKHKTLTKVSSLDDLADIDLDDLDELDLTELGMDDIDFDNFNFEELTQDQADMLLKLVVAVAGKELPEDMGDGMELTALDMKGRDVIFSVEMDMTDVGISMADFVEVMNMPEMKNEMMKGMIKDMDDDMAAFLQVMVAAKKNFVMKFIDKNTGDDVDLRLKSSELKEML
ncbi:MAG: hypothetical protein II792_00190 [Prevotella sp.]|nr:hypothetical protein [Prevotella sp.]